jgi:methylated-DNA-protein-cysteine methyltransferase-like protein
MVGYALNALPLHERDAVPAHRVVNRQGMLTGKAYFGTPERMQQLLKAEGIEVVADRVQDFDRLLWHPAQALWG